MNYNVKFSTSLQHHGVQGQRWGVKHGPPYPLTKIKNTKPKDIIDIENTWTKQEKSFMYGDEDYTPTLEELKQYLNSERNPISKTLFVKNTPVSYMGMNEITSTNADKILNMYIGTRNGEEYRQKGYADKLVKKGLNWFNKHQSSYNYVIWEADVKNIASNNLAKKNGFEYIGKDVNQMYQMNVYAIGKKQLSKIGLHIE